jgi:hypothetical protein
VSSVVAARACATLRLCSERGESTRSRSSWPWSSRPTRSGQRLRPRSNERAAQPRRRPVVPRDVVSVDPLGRIADRRT